MPHSRSVQRALAPWQRYIGSPVWRAWCAIGILLLMTSAARAQQRPLVTEDPEPVGAGRVLLEAGLDYGRDAQFPASGLQGHLTRAPLIGVSIGISSIAELQIDGGVWNRLAITGRRPAPLAGLVTASDARTSDVEDLVIATKVRIMAEGPRRPAFGVRFATRLPNASNESGLGLDTTDFLATVLVGKTARTIRVVGNVGMGILSDPVRGDRQNDVLLYGLSFAKALTQGAEIVAELNGRADTRTGDPPPGTESRSLMRFGARWTRGLLRLDGGLLVGLTDNDPGVGVMAGFTYVFNAFRVP